MKTYLYLNKRKVLHNVKKLYRNVRADNSNDHSPETLLLTVLSGHTPMVSLGMKEKGQESSAGASCHLGHGDGSILEPMFLGE